MGLEPAGEVVLVWPAHRAPDAGDGVVGVQQQHRRPLGPDLRQVGLRRQPRGVLEQPYQVRRRQVELLRKVSERPRAGDVGLEHPHRAPHRRMRPALGGAVRVVGRRGGAAELAKQRAGQAEDVAPEPVQGAVPERVQGLQVRVAAVVGGGVQAEAQHAAARCRVRPVPQQVAEQRVLARPGELPVQQLAAEAEVVEHQPLAALVGVPDARPEQHDVPAGQLNLSGQAVVRAAAVDDDRDLDEPVGVHRVPVHVQVQPGVGERPLGEVQRAVLRVHRHVFVGHVLDHVRTIRPDAAPVML